MALRDVYNQIVGHFRDFVEKRDLRHLQRGFDEVARAFKIYIEPVIPMIAAFRESRERDQAELTWIAGGKVYRLKLLYMEVTAMDGEEKEMMCINITADGETIADACISARKQP